jgi:hypothetical protein
MARGSVFSIVPKVAQGISTGPIADRKSLPRVPGVICLRSISARIITHILASKLRHSTRRLRDDGADRRRMSVRR